MIPLLTRERSRAFDADWIARGVPGLVLMENAGRGAADLAVARLLRGDAAGKRVVILCGRGNNAGDGFVVARRLHVLGADVRVLTTEDVARLAGDAAIQAAAYRALGAPLHPWEGAGQLASVDLVVDALFGTGLTRALEGAWRTPYAPRARAGRRSWRSTSPPASMRTPAACTETSACGPR